MLLGSQTVGCALPCSPGSVAAAGRGAASAGTRGAGQFGWAAARHTPCRSISRTEILARLWSGSGEQRRKTRRVPMSPGPVSCCPRNTCPVVATYWQKLQLLSPPPYRAVLCAMPPRFVCCHCGDVELHEEFPAGPKASSSTLPLTQPSPFPYFLLFPFQWVSYSIYNFLYYSTLIDYLLCGALLNVL